MAFASLGVLADGALNTGTSASEADDRIIFDLTTGALLYDVDGLGGTSAVQFATLTGAPSGINNTDFLII